MAEAVIQAEEQGAVAHLLDYLLAEGLPLVARPLPATLPDPDDQPFWEVAVETTASLITGNVGCSHPQHFPQEGCKDVEVLTPAAFIERWRSGHP
jgi:hypothetical protein